MTLTDYESIPIWLCITSPYYNITKAPSNRSNMSRKLNGKEDRNQLILELKKQGMSGKEIGEKVGLDKSTVYSIVSEYNRKVC